MNISRTLAALGVGVAAIGMATAAPASAGDELRGARAVLVDTAGAEVGVARFVEDATGHVHVSVRVVGFTPGEHGIHVHAVGACSPDFNAAGSHHNPLGAAHGAHAGDLLNLIVNRAGRGSFHAMPTSFTLSPGPTSVFDADGSALVVHADPDDYVTQPTGGSGARIACGVITPD